MTNQNLETPQLQKPGAGLPFFEALLLRFAFPRYARKMNWDEAQRLFDKEGEKILALVRPLDNEVLGRRVLIPRIRGLEDSSRFWSVAMTLEHIVIVGQQLEYAIVMLSKGELPDGKADIAAVKPKGLDEPGQAVRSFEAFVEQFRESMNTKVGDRDSRLTFRHPWFGMLNAFQWHFLAAGHQNLHRKQIQLILESQA